MPTWIGKGATVPKVAPRQWCETGRYPMIGSDWSAVQSGPGFLAQESLLVRALAMRTIRFGSEIVSDAILIEKLPPL